MAHDSIRWTVAHGRRRLDWHGRRRACLPATPNPPPGRPRRRARPRKSKEVVAAIAPFLFIAGLLIGVPTLLDVRRSRSTRSTQLAGAVAKPALIHCAHARRSCGYRWPCWAACVRADVRGGARGHQRIQSQCLLPPSPRPLLSGRDALRAGRTPATELHRLRRQGRHPAGRSGRPRRRPAPGPLHIVNCALNLGGSSDLALHTRHSAAFTLTPLTCGSGYLVADAVGRTRRSSAMCRPASTAGPLGAPTLGQAISVSGAAASPNMGYHTSPVVAFLLTRVQRAAWLVVPQPRRRSTRRSRRRTSTCGTCLRSSLAAPTTSRKFLMISDGGHFENLAAYELIRRRCRTIIISDGECDPAADVRGPRHAHPHVRGGFRREDHDRRRAPSAPPPRRRGARSGSPWAPSPMVTAPRRARSSTSRRR